MAKRKYSAPLPKIGSVVMVQGVIRRLVVVSVNKANETAIVCTTTAPPASYTVAWSKLSVLDESQNALRVVKEATEGE
jgi:hypothetical protein